MTLLRSMPGLVLLLEPRAPFRILEASDDYLAATLTRRESIVGVPVFDVFPVNPSDPGGRGVDTVRASLEKVTASGAPDVIERLRYDVRRPDGNFEVRWWHTVNAPIVDDGGRVESIIQRVDDVTALVTMAAARDTELRAAEVLESITEGVFLLDHDFRLTYVNKEGRRILAGDGDIVGRVIWDVYPGLYESAFGLAYRKTMAEGVAASLTAFYEGHGRWYEVNVYPAPGGISVYFRDVTRQKTVEAEREQLAHDSDRQRRIYEAVLSSTPDLVYIFDLEHRFIYANEALLNMWGRTAEDALGKNWLELGYEAWHADMHDREMETVIATRQPVQGEVPFEGAAGRRYWNYIFVPVLGADGEVVAIAGTSRDTTERRQADRAKDEFIATLSHELRNPLAPLRNSVALLRMMGAGADERIARVGKTMERQVDHLVRLVDDLLEISRVTRGDFSLQVEPVSLVSVVRDVLETCASIVKARKHSVELVIEDEDIWIDADAVRIGQIIANLVDNAAKYTPEGGSIRVSVGRGDGDQAVVRVRDDGLGISPAGQQAIFRMFSRGDRANKHGEGGLGIGLALARRLAELHRGTLEAQSEGVGRGSKFTLRMPFSRATQELPAHSPASGLRLCKRILVVDDNRDAADTMGLILTELGADVRVAHGGQEAISAFPEFEPAAVLLDIGMPMMDGYEVARRLRAGDPQRRVRLIALTGWGQEQDRQRAKEAGFDHHITKPADLHDLQALLASI